jgi:GH25 family lysozyme M1 (1,4-beta-N-acetylmuramidase)
MTIFGTDMSHYDAALPDLGARLVSGGFAFATHKAGGDATDAKLNAFWNAVKDQRGQLLVGAYWVLLPGDPTGKADAFLARLDAACPGWRDGPFILQADCEIWNGDRSTQPGRIQIKAFCDRLKAKAPELTAIVYASKGQYGDALVRLGYPLWNANYPISRTGSAASLYRQAGGDSGPGWQAYSGQTPAIWQFSSSATIAGLTTCDADAYRGTLAELTALVAPGWSANMDLTPENLTAIAKAVATYDINPDSTTSTTWAGAAWDTLNRTGALKGISAVPSADQTAQAVLTALGTGQSPEQIAAILKAIPGFPAAEVGAALQAA